MVAFLNFTLSQKVVTVFIVVICLCTGKVVEDANVPCASQ